MIESKIKLNSCVEGEKAKPLKVKGTSIDKHNFNTALARMHVI